MSSSTLPPPCEPGACRCGRTFTASAWWALSTPPGGDLWETGFDDERGVFVALRLRNCPCGSTLAQEVLSDNA